MEGPWKPALAEGPPSLNYMKMKMMFSRATMGVLGGLDPSPFQQKNRSARDVFRYLIGPFYAGPYNAREEVWSTAILGQS